MRNEARLLVIKGSVKSWQGRNADVNILGSYRRDHKIPVNIRNTLRLNNAMVTKADKGNTVVVMSNDVYVQKVEQFINDNDINRLDNDPTTKFAKEINNTINTCNALFKRNGQRRLLQLIKPHAPRLNDLPKIHKENMPIRPSVDYTSAPGYKVAKKTVKSH